MRCKATEQLFQQVMGYAQAQGVNVSKFLRPPFVRHELDHLRRTAILSEEIAEVTPGADVLSAVLAGALHDIGRDKDNYDPGHGARGAALVQKHRLLDPWLDQLQDPDVILFAIHHHSDPVITRHPTVGAVWDADRLELRRAGELPDPARLSTLEGKRRAHCFQALARGVGYVYK